MEEKPLNWDSAVGELVLSDVIEWTETIWPVRKPRRKQRPKPLGKQKVTGQITGIEEDFITLIILKAEITDNPHRADIKPHQVGTAITKKKQTILKGEPQRLRWSEEDVRTALVNSSNRTIVSYPQSYT
jgi:hypothetical protein